LYFNYGLYVDSEPPDYGNAAYANRLAACFHTTC
jgi:hypothetical protein